MSSTGKHISVLGQCLESPMITFLILFAIAIWVYIYTSTLDNRTFQLDLKEFPRNREWWRFPISSYSHFSFFHLLFCVTSLWTYRSLEVINGSGFIFKYTIVLIFVSRLVSISWLKLIRSRLGSNASLYSSQNISLGFVPEILGWLSFKMITTEMRDGIYIFGLLPVPVWLGPLLMMMVAQMISPQLSILVNYAGFITGIFLGFGWLQILPNFYWTICFLFNVLLVCLWSLYISPTHVAHYENENTEVLDVFPVVPFSEDIYNYNNRIDNEVLESKTNSNNNDSEDSFYGSHIQSRQDIV